MSSVPDFDAPLRSLVAQAAEFAEQSPEAAAAGQWWYQQSPGLPPQAARAPATMRQASVLVLLWEEDDGARLLLTERSTALAKHPGQISFPGGAAEAGDADPAGTALRETHEELGLDPARVEVLGPLPPAPVPSGFSVVPVLAVAEDLGVLTPDPGEVARVIKAPVADLLNSQHRYSAVIEREGIRLRSPAFFFGEGTADAAFVWGFTGLLLDRMLHRLGWAREWDESRELDPRRFKR